VAGVIILGIVGANVHTLAVQVVCALGILALAAYGGWRKRGPAA